MKAKELKNIVMDKVQTASKQIHGVESEVGKIVKSVQQQVKATQADGAKKLEDLLGAVALTDFLDKIRSVEKITQGKVKQDILGNFGLVAKSEFDKLKEQVQAVEDKQTQFATKKNTVSRKQFHSFVRKMEK